MNIKVKKRDQTVEDWSSDKLLNSLISSGLAIEDAKKLSQEIELELVKNQESGHIDSSKIKDIVAKHLEKSFPIEASVYSNYKK